MGMSRSRFGGERITLSLCKVQHVAMLALSACVLVDYRGQRGKIEDYDDYDSVPLSRTPR